MSMPICCSMSFLVLIAAVVPGYAAEENALADDLQQRLTGKDFENISVTLEGRRVIVTYENRVYRYEIRAIREVMATILPLIAEGTDVVLIPQNRGIPLIAVTISADEYVSLLNGQISGEEFASAIDVSLDVKKSLGEMENIQRPPLWLYRFGIIFNPQIKVQLGNVDDPVESQVNIVPEVRANLWRGMSLSAQLIIPLQNELERDGDDWRPGLLTMNQTLRLPQNTFISGTVGYFSRNRYGMDMEIKKRSANGIWAVGVNLGYTGHASYQQGVWRYSDLGRLTGFANAQYRLSRFDLILSASYGRFLYGDMGARMDVLRQFEEVDIGFYGIKTEAGYNVGFNFSIPIFPSRHVLAGPVKIGPAREFPWEYRYRGIPNYGIHYRTGNDIDSFMKKLDPSHTKRAMLQLSRKPG